MNELNLNEGEQTLYECYGKLKHSIMKMSPSGRRPKFSGREPVRVSMSSGKIIITNNRIIAQGKIKVKGGRTGTGSALDLIIAPLSGHSKRAKIKTDLLRDGYEIPVGDIGGLRKIRNGIAFGVMGGNHPGIVKIKPHGTSQVKLTENKEKLFELLSEFTKMELPNYARRRIICCVLLITIITFAALLIAP